MAQQDSNNEIRHAITGKKASVETRLKQSIAKKNYYGGSKCHLM